MENPYIKQYPDIMQGKKILYVHGFCSSGQSGTVTRLRDIFPNTTIVAPDLPIRPTEAVELLRQTCDEEKPDLIIGTSMGGMYAEMLHGHHRILVNPAFEMGKTMGKNGHIGKNTFFSPRQDGVQEFIITKSMVKEYEEITQQCFSNVTENERKELVFGLFGDADPVVHTYDLFHNHYPNAIRFHGEHRMNDDIVRHALVPVIRWIDDKQEGKERPTVLISIDALRNKHNDQHPGAVKAFRELAESYNVFIIADSPTAYPAYIGEVQEWAQEFINVYAHNHIIFCNRKNLMLGDYLIDPSEDNGADEFMGTLIEFGSDKFKTWEETMEFFGRLGGQ
ncbi:MAG: esterase [Prevotella sp.]|nr:esterase [Prevotella sp.]